jgi:MFS family permease
LSHTAQDCTDDAVSGVTKPADRGRSEAARDQDAPEQSGWLKYFQALRHLKYRWYWFSGLGMTAAQGFQQLGMAWLVLDLTGSVGQLGLVVFFQGVPMAVASFFGGVLADRYDRRKLLMAAQAVTMTNLLILAVLTMSDVVAVWHIYLSSIGLGLMQSVTMPARSALVRSLVGPADMVNAVALNAIQMHSSRILWPSLAGGVIALAGPGATLLVSACASFTGIACIWMIGAIAKDEARPERISHAAEMREGVRYTFSEPGVSTIMWLCIAAGLFGLAYISLAPAFAREELELGPGSVGLFMMSSGVGAIIGSIWLLAFPIKDGLWAFTFTLLLFAFDLMLQAAVPFVPATFVLMGIWGAVSAIGVTAGQTYLQMNVPQRLMGRVIGLWSLAGSLGFVTALPIGILGDEIGLRPTLIGVGAMLAVLTVWFGIVVPTRARPATEAATSAVAGPVE